jgi:plastocyanin
MPRRDLEPARKLIAAGVLDCGLRLDRRGATCWISGAVQVATHRGGYCHDMQKVILLLAVAAVAVCAAIAVPALAATKRVSVGPGESFSPRSLTVPRGTQLTFRWTGDEPHNVVATSGPVLFHTPVRRAGATFTKRFTKAGTYRIVCTLHDGMRLRLTVR